ncbi:MAG TPA: IPT/TIG domain-containing protein [Thermoanaerobaculia bacterium]|jgi:PKD repeat protein|nr:IPT/TIG domain-containing protein [Thermoanaerobaculia bacterium]
MNTTRAWKAAFAIGALALSAGLAGCSSKSSPTAPATGGGGVPPSGGVGNGTWNITVVATPGAVELPDVGEPTPTVSVTISVRNASTGSPPPDGTTIVVSATGGTLSGQSFCSGSTTTLCPQLIGGETSVIFTPTTAGTAVITAQLEQSIGRATVAVSGVPIAGVFTLDHAEPNSGDPSGGFRVSLFGQNFEAPISVLFGGSNAQVVSVSPNRAVVIAPPLTTPLAAGAIQPVTITVTNAIGTTHESSASLINGFIYANGGNIETPVIFTFTPTTGPQEGGTPIVISGSHFAIDSQVIFRIGNIDLEAPTNFASSGRLESLTPDIRPYIAAGTLSSPFNATVRVVNPNGSFSDAPGQFTYGSTIRITSIAPGSGPFTGGTAVTIFGSGFDEPVAVTLGGVAQQVLSVSGTEIRFVTSALTGTDIPPCNGTVSRAVTVTNIEGGASASGPSFTFTGPPSPLILGVIPTGGDVDTIVTISGQNFDPSALRVLFGGADGSSASIQGTPTSSSVVVKVPTPPGGFTFTTVACDDNHDGTQGTKQGPTPISITVRNVITGCEATLSNAFTLNPPPPNLCVGDTAPTTGTAPTASFTATPGAAATHTVQFTDTSTGSPTTWQWDFTNDGIVDSTVQNPSNNYSAAGPFTVKLTVSNASGSSSVTQVVNAP